MEVRNIGAGMTMEPYFDPRDTSRLGIYRFNGKEKDYESGFHYYGARYHWSEVLTSFISVDRYADKYPFLSPYAYCALNPIRLNDPSGDSIMVCRQNQEDGNERLFASISRITGLNLYVSENGRMLYEKLEDGTPIVNGGSLTARNDLIKAIEDPDFNLILKYDNGNPIINGGGSDRRSSDINQSRIIIDLADFSGKEQETFDIGMVFFHEFQHGYFGLVDNVNPRENIYSCQDNNYYKKKCRGDVVDKVNVYRRELGLPTREAYKKSPYTNQIPFSYNGQTIWIDGY